MKYNKTEIKEIDNYLGVFATEDIKEGETIFNINTSIVTNKPSVYSVQIGAGKHVQPPDNIDVSDKPDYFWKYLNHSCEPNSYCNLNDLTFKALRDIKKGEHITFNYLTTEEDMNNPFKCNCKSEKCFKYIRGYKYLSEQEKEMIHFNYSKV
jgi:hypothetical protein